jgi:hypothetical protein
MGETTLERFEVDNDRGFGEVTLHAYVTRTRSSETKQRQLASVSSAPNFGCLCWPCMLLLVP